MNEYVIRLSDHQVAGLNVIVARYNADNKAALTVSEWLQLHAGEIAIQEELAAEHARLTAQAEQDVRAALIIAKDRLLSPDATSGEGGEA